MDQENFSEEMSQEGDSKFEGSYDNISFDACKGIIRKFQYENESAAELIKGIQKLKKSGILNNKKIDISELLRKDNDIFSILEKQSSLKKASSTNTNY